MKYILRMFGLVRLKDVNNLLDDEAKYWDKKRKELRSSEDILKENCNILYSHYAQCSRDLKLSFFLLNKWW